jgi:thiol-disulfide isomerase/thioredoxin
VIHGLGYKTTVVADPKTVKPTVATIPRKAPVPKDAPGFFGAAMRRAQRLRRPVVIDFWATWCAPCKKLKKLTMESKDVAEVLRGMEVIYVDLDAHPSLAKAYGVKSIPDVFFLDADGVIVDRLKKFEAAPAFLARLKKLTTVRIPKKGGLRVPK